VPQEMIQLEIFVEWAIKIVEAHDELKFKKKTVTRKRQTMPI
jgi:hypothetical protein